MAGDFKVFILLLGIGFVAVAWISENYMFPRLVKCIGVFKVWATRKPKERKAYKRVLGQMRTLQ
jgi:cation-transporting ATPase 13A2